METWRDIAGYEGLYQVSDEGNVRRLVAMGRWNQYPAMGLFDTTPRSSGYKVLTLTDHHGDRETVLLHRLVAVAFLGDPPTPKHEINHKDGDKTNNAVSNLEWVTSSQNKIHSIHQLGNNDRLKLTLEEVRAIRLSDLPQRTLAKLYGISQNNVSRIKQRKAWRHVD